MLHRYTSVATLLLALTLSGCAGSPDRQNPMSGESTRPAVANSSLDIESEYQAALSLMKDENWQNAADKLATITATDPQLSGAWTNLGIARTRIGDLAGAEQAFRSALSSNGSQVTAYNELGILCRRSGRLEEAAELYNSALNINPNAEDIHWNLGILYDRYLSNPAQALYHYERYQALTQSQDGQLLGWIDELRNQSSEVAVAAGAKQ